MISEAQQSDWFLHHLSQSAGIMPGRGVAWLDALRSDARAAIARLTVLNRKQEAWRYTSVEPLLQQRFITAGTDIGAFRNLDIRPWILPGMDAFRLVFVNGRYLPRLSAVDDLPEGVTVGSLRTALSTDPGRLATWFEQQQGRSDNLFTALNSALINDGALIHIGRHVVLRKPLEIVYLSLDQERSLLVQPRNLVILEAGAEATLVERFVGSEKTTGFNNHVTGIQLSGGASLDHYRLQDESDRTFHLSSISLSQLELSRYRCTHLSFGGAWARTDCETLLKQPGAKCELNGLYTVGDGQLNDFHLRVRHMTPGCTSRERFKGILHGKGRAVFDGHIIVDKDAQQSDAQLRNDNLMLTRGAEVDTKPQLEIYADNVKCSHGTTVGEIDPAQIFYLRSRGIARTKALSMLSLGFAADISNEIKPEPLRGYVERRLLQKLGGEPDGDNLSEHHV
ncbi:MAG: Fe-S cluster assembly protein SufD [Gammaproteobacteria bacterium]|nr:Fe-S cluster assembly protein SufD [Gammaproteobacteria bacterium]